MNIRTILNFLGRMGVNFVVLLMLQARGLLALFLMGFAGHALAVSMADCAQEQQAFIHAMTHWSSPDGDREGVESGAESTRKWLLSGENDSIPWHISDANGVKNARDAQSTVQFWANELKKDEETLRSYQTHPFQGLGDPRMIPDIVRDSAAKTRLKVCLFEVRLRELSAGGSSTHPTSPATAKAELGSQCTSDAANKELQAIDQRLGDFRESPAGQQTGTVTPSLQAVMWGTSKQAEVIKKYCPDSPGFKSRLEELNNAYGKAFAACRQINSNPDQYCIPALPDNVGYQDELPNAPVQNMGSSTGELASTAQTPGDTNNVDDENTAGRTNKKPSKNTKKEKSSSSKTAQNKKQKPHGPINASSCISEKNSRMVNICDFDVEVAFCVENPQQTKNFFDGSDAFKCPNGGLSTVPAGQAEPNILHGHVQWFACSTVDIATMQARYDGSTGYKGKCY